jgi:hypothetical protein
MNRTAVTSSSLEAVGYDAETSTLEIEFRDGSIYQYFDVSEAGHTELITAPSHGRYFSEQIRGMYRYARV